MTAITRMFKSDFSYNLNFNLFTSNTRVFVHSLEKKYLRLHDSVVIVPNLYPNKSVKYQNDKNRCEGQYLL